MAFVAKVRSYIAGWLTLGVLGAVVLVAVSIWQVIDNFEVATEPAVLQYNALPDLTEGEKRYVRIEGGYYDEDHGYEYSTIEKSKTGREKTVKVESFLPFVHEDSGDIAYVVSFDNKYQDDEGFADNLTLGLLRSADEIPADIRSAFAEHYGHSNFLLLQSDYKSQTLLEQLGEVLIFIGLLIVVIVLRWLVAPKAEA